MNLMSEANREDLKIAKSMSSEVRNYDEYSGGAANSGNLQQLKS
jgi:hypothetical protein